MAAVDMLLRYLSDNPMEKLPKIFSIIQKLDRQNLYSAQIHTIREKLMDEKCVWRGFTESLLRNVDMKLLKKIMAYRKHQPFNCNHLRPCPLLDNPEKLVTMVNESGAASTDMEAPENVDELCAKTAPIAEKWACTANVIWEEKFKNVNDPK